MKSKVIIKIVYDNYVYESSIYKPDWGFSCLIRYPQKTMLFDTGGNGDILLYNMAKIGIDPAEINAVALSHVHGDHTGGLGGLLNYNSNLTIYMPSSFPRGLKDGVKIAGAKVEEVDKNRKLCGDVSTTGELNGGIKEQALILGTPKGLVVLTGCAHPGIVNIVNRVKEISGEKIYLLMGGFHLGEMYQSQINYVAERLLHLGVEKVSPCHCSGEETRIIFKKYFGDNYIQCGIGREIIIE